MADPDQKSITGARLESSTQERSKFEVRSPYAEPAPDAECVAIVKVDEAGYVPDGVTVRSRANDVMFTASFPASLRSALEADAHVVSVGTARVLRGRKF